MHEQGVVWRDGELIPFADATCHVLSHMAARGSQIFDVLLVTPTDDGPCAVGLRQHVTRFLRSAEMIGMERVGAVGDIERAVARTVMANAELSTGGSAPVTVKIIAAWEDQPIGILPADLRPTVFVVAMTNDGSGPRDLAKTPIRVCSADMPKMPAEILPPSMKVAASYTPGVRAQLAARAAGFDHTVFKTVDGDLAESTTLSMLVIKNGRVLAPPLDNVLDGITRRVVLDAAQHYRLPVEIRPVWWDEVESADELLLSSTNKPVLPVGVLDERSLAAPGPITEALAETVAEIYGGGHALSASWLTPLQALT